jgi:hypothetical protein
MENGTNETNRTNETIEYENVPLGTEQPPVTPKTVRVTGYEVRPVCTTEGKEIGNKLVLKVNHPEVPDMEISKVKFEKNKKLTESGLWVSMDKDGNIPFASALAHLLRFYRCESIAHIKGKEIDTTTDENGYIIAKAY